MSMAIVLRLTLAEAEALSLVADNGSQDSDVYEGCDGDEGDEAAWEAAAISAMAKLDKAIYAKKSKIKS